MFFKETPLKRMILAVLRRNQLKIGVFELNPRRNQLKIGVFNSFLEEIN